MPRLQFRAQHPRRLTSSRMEAETVVCGGYGPSPRSSVSRRTDRRRGPGDPPEIWEMIYAAVATGTTVFVTTHYMDEAEYCNRVSIMVDGRIRALDTPAGLKQATARNQWTKYSELCPRGHTNRMTTPTDEHLPFIRKKRDAPHCPRHAHHGDSACYAGDTAPALRFRDLHRGQQHKCCSSGAGARRSHPRHDIKASKPTHTSRSKDVSPRTTPDACCKTAMSAPW